MLSNHVEYLESGMPFKDAKSFFDVFESAVPYDHKQPLKDRLEWTMVGDYKELANHHTSGNVITNYCMVSGKEYRSFHVRPKQEVIEYVRNNMIPVYYDHIYFQVVVRNDNTALITASYNQIIGSRWLALVDADTVPKGG